MGKYIYKKRETDSIEVIYILEKNTVLDELCKVFGFQHSTFYFCKQNQLYDLESIYKHYKDFGNFSSLEVGNTIEASLELIEFCELIVESSDVTLNDSIIIVDDSEVEDVASDEVSEEFTRVIENINERYDISLLDEFPNLYSDYANKSVNLFRIINYTLQIWRGLSEEEQSFLKFIFKNNSFSIQEYSGVSNSSVHNANLLKTELLKKLSLDTSSPLRHLPKVFQGRCSFDIFEDGSVLWILDRELNSNIQEVDRTNFPLGFTCLILSSYYKSDIRWLKLEDEPIEKRIQNFSNVELFIDNKVVGKEEWLFVKKIYHNFEQLFEVEREYYERKNISLIIKEFASDDYAEKYKELVNAVRRIYTNDNLNVEERIQTVSKLRAEFRELFSFYYTVLSRILEYFYNSSDYMDNSSVSILLDGDNELGVREQREESTRINLDDIQLFPDNWTVEVVEHPYFTNSLVIYGEETYSIRNKLKHVAKYYRNVNIGEKLVPGWIISQLKYKVLLSYYNISNFLLLENLNEFESRELLVELFNKSPNALLIRNINELIGKIIEELPDNIEDLNTVIRGFDSTIDLDLLNEIAPLILMVLES